MGRIDLGFHDKEVWDYLRYNAFVSKRHKLIYVATPKVACTSLKWWFADLEGVTEALRRYPGSAESDPDLIIHDTFHKVAPDVTGLSPGVLAGPISSDDFFRFAVVRNPYKRIFSAWQSKLLVREPLQIEPYFDCDFFNHPIENFSDIAQAFQSFLEHVADHEVLDYKDAHWTPQVRLLRPDLISYSKITQIEDIDDLDIALQAHLGPGVPSPFSRYQINESLMPFLPVFVTERSAELIQTLYSEDFETFNYSLELPVAKDTFPRAQLDVTLRAVGLIRGRHQRLREMRTWLTGELDKQLAKLEQERKIKKEQQEAIADLTGTVTERNNHIINLKNTVAERNNHIINLKNTVAERNNHIINLKNTVAERNNHIVNLKNAIAKRDGQLAKIRDSISWKVMAPLRWQSWLEPTLLGRAIKLIYWLLTLQLFRQVKQRREIEFLSNNGLFDETFYLHYYQDVAAAGMNAARHYLEFGAAEGRNPNAYFDIDYYLSQNPDILEADIDPLRHYIDFGWRKGRNPNAYFDIDYYLSQNPDILKADIDPLRHYIDFGWREGRNPNAYFDIDYYLSQNPDILKADIDPLRHYIDFGWREGRNPNAYFDIDYYLSQNPDILEADIDPLRHYIDFGWREGRNPIAYFDTNFYLSENPDIADAKGVNPLLHFIDHGWREDRDPGPYFNTNFYLSENPDIAAAGLNPLLHFIQFGWFEGRNPNPYFDIEYYLANNPDVVASGSNPLSHYLEFGDKEGRVTRKIKTDYLPESPVEHYDAWMRVNRFCNSKLFILKSALAECQEKLPKISVILPVYDTPLTFLELSIGSVFNQVYDNWELCIADDGSSNHQVVDYLRWCVGQDRRIKAVFCKENGGISKATNCAATLATGEILAFLDHDDELTRDALAEIALYYTENPSSDIVYSDDDKIDPQGCRFMPQFKPDWSPVLLLSYFYQSHLLTVRRSLFERVKGFRSGFEGSQDFDFVLQASEQARHIGHIPKILYHWRTAPGSTAISGNAKPSSFEAGRQAVVDAFKRRGYGGEVDQPQWAKDLKLGIFKPLFPDDGPSVTIIIPTKNSLHLLRRCVESLKCTDYNQFDVLVVDNDSDDQETTAYLKEMKHCVVQISNPKGQFNFSYLMNRAVLQVKSDFIVFLNNDVEVVSPKWLSQMMGYAQMDGVGAVGAQLLFPDGTIQHAGVVHGYNNGCPGHAFKNRPVEEGYLSYPQVAREYSAVTAACMLTPKQLFLEIGGFDEDNFAVAYNDADYCYRLIDNGYRCISCPEELVHHEGGSRGMGDASRELAAVRAKYGDRVDPWYNPNLSLRDESFQVHPYCDPGKVHRPVRVLMFSHNLNFEGAPKFLFELCAGLAQQKIIEPIISSPQDGPLRRAYEAEGIEVLLFSGPNTCQPEHFSRELDRVAQFIRKTGAQVVHANTADMYWAIAAAQHCGLPSLWNIHESEPWQSYFDNVQVGYRELAYHCFSQPYRVIFVSFAGRQHWAKLESRHNFTVIHNGLDLDRLSTGTGSHGRHEARQRLSIDNDTFVFILVGTVCERKGQIDIVQAMSQLDKKVSKTIHCFIVGDRRSSYSDKLHEQISHLPTYLKNRVTVVEKTDKVSQYYLAADAAVCCSKIESYPLIILEALAYGLPLIVTPVFGIPEQVREGINCLFYPPGDIKALGQAITKLVDDDDLRAKFVANAGPTLASLTSYSEMVNSYGHLFREASVASVDLSFSPLSLFDREIFEEIDLV